MKTLIIHPKDPTTDFLVPCYTGRGWTEITTNVSRSYLRREIMAHDRIIMMGHGTEQGLLGFSRIVVGSGLVDILRSKLCVCVWCNADMFVCKYGLTGFYTGMIVSDYEEAMLYSLRADLKEIEQSNLLFADALKQAINSRDMLGIVQDFYEGESEVINFNRKNLYQT